MTSTLLPGFPAVCSMVNPIGVTCLYREVTLHRASARVTSCGFR
ncbi:MAG TPA: hypothetical protein VND19_02305 [Acetobacteraceae bacterium]|nr:hypothetical protein [Acetobacteraceae bacterium]